MGMRVAPVSNCSQIRQPAGNTTLSNAARTLVSHPPANPRTEGESARSDRPAFMGEVYALGPQK
jgi:hypothetical protein